MLGKTIAIVGLVAAGLLLIVLTMTTPPAAGAAGILAVFLLTYIVLLSLLTFGLWAVVKMINKFGHNIHVLHSKHSLSLQKSYYYSTVLALGPIIIISLQSVGSVSIYELSLVILFVTLGCVYVSKRVA